MSFVWDDTAVATLKRLKSDGHTAARIAQMLGSMHQSVITKNAVLGQIWRMGLSTTRTDAAALERARRERSAAIRAEAKRAKEAAKPKPAPVVALPDAPTPIPIDTRVGKLSFDQLEPEHCRWPLGDPRHINFGFCGEPRLPGRPYCPGCTSRSIQPRTPTKRAA
jgi:GcrA cell cycle regulator